MKTLFKNGTIIDGSGEKPYVGDVLIEDDVILKVGGSIDDIAKKVIDITGLEICPGLIDAHSHNDFFYDRDDAEKFYKPFIQQGITTQVTGNCSFSPFGMDADTPYRDKIGGGLFDAVDSADGEPVLIHDERVDRTSDGVGFVGRIQTTMF